jgi:DNA repair exonuclease SbcCD ATPase subunit
MSYWKLTPQVYNNHLYNRTYIGGANDTKETITETNYIPLAKNKFTLLMKLTNSSGKLNIKSIFNPKQLSLENSKDKLNSSGLNVYISYIISYDKYKEDITKNPNIITVESQFYNWEQTKIDASGGIEEQQNVLCKNITFVLNMLFNAHNTYVYKNIEYKFTNYNWENTNYSQNGCDATGTALTYKPEYDSFFEKTFSFQENIKKIKETSEKVKSLGDKLKQIKDKEITRNTPHLEDLETKIEYAFQRCNQSMYSIQILYNEWIKSKRTLFGLTTPYSDFSTKDRNNTILKQETPITYLNQVDELVTQLLYELQDIYTIYSYFAKLNMDTAKNILKLERGLSSKGFNDIPEALYSKGNHNTYVDKSFKEKLERDGYTDQFPFLLGFYKTLAIIIENKKTTDTSNPSDYIRSVYSVNQWTDYLYNNVLNEISIGGTNKNKKKKLRPSTTPTSLSSTTPTSLSSTTPTSLLLTTPTSPSSTTPTSPSSTTPTSPSPPPRPDSIDTTDNKLYIDNAIATYCFFEYFYKWLMENSHYYLEQILSFNIQDLVALYNNWEKYKNNKSSPEIKTQTENTIFTLANVLRTNYKQVETSVKEYKQQSITKYLDSNGIDITGIYCEHKDYEVFSSNSNNFLNVNYYQANEDEYKKLLNYTYKKVSSLISETRRTTRGGANEISTQDLAISAFSNTASKLYITPQESITVINELENNKRDLCLKPQYLIGACFNSNIRCTFIRRDVFDKSLFYAFMFVTTTDIKLEEIVPNGGGGGGGNPLTPQNINNDYRYKELQTKRTIEEKLNCLKDNILRNTPAIVLINLLNNNNTYELKEFNKGDDNVEYKLILIEGTNIYVYHKVKTNSSITINTDKPVTVEECSLYFTFDGQRSIPTLTSTKDKKDGFFVLLNATISAVDPKKEFKQTCEEKKSAIEQDYSSLKTRVQSDSFWKLSESNMNFNLYEALSGKSNNPALTNKLNEPNDGQGSGPGNAPFAQTQKLIQYSSKQIEELKRLLEESKKKQQDTEIQLEETKAKLESTLPLLQSSKDQHSELTQQNKKLKTDIDMLEEMNVSQKRTITSLDGELNESKKDIDKLKKEINTSKDEITNLSNKITELTSSITQLKNEKKELLQENKDLKAGFETQQKVISDNKLTIQNLTTQLTENLKNIEALTNKLTHANEENQKIVTQIKELKVINMGLDQQVAKLTEDIKTNENRIEEQSKIIDQNKTQIKQLEKTINQQTQELTELGTQNQHLQNQIQEKSQELEQTQKQMDSIQNKLNDMIEHNATLNAENTRITQELNNNLITILNTIKTNCQDLLSHLDANAESNTKIILDLNNLIVNIETELEKQNHKTDDVNNFILRLNHIRDSLLEIDAIPSRPSQVDLEHDLGNVPLQINNKKKGEGEKKEGKKGQGQGEGSDTNEQQPPPPPKMTQQILNDITLTLNDKKSNTPIDMKYIDFMTQIDTKIRQQNRTTPQPPKQNGTTDEKEKKKDTNKYNTFKGELNTALKQWTPQNTNLNETASKVIQELLNNNTIHIKNKKIMGGRQTKNNRTVNLSKRLTRRK